MTLSVVNGEASESRREPALEVRGRVVGLLTGEEDSIPFIRVRVPLGADEYAFLDLPLWWAKGSEARLGQDHYRALARKWAGEVLGEVVVSVQRAP